MTAFLLPKHDELVGADIAWLLVATAMVLLMTAGLAFFYGGMVRSKNALNTMMMSFATMGVVAVVWAVAGYSIAFAPGTSLFGGLDHVFLAGVGLEANGTVPHLLFMAFQGTFAIITVALISGAVVERMRFGPFLAFAALWTLVVYAPICHWQNHAQYPEPQRACICRGGSNEPLGSIDR